MTPEDPAPKTGEEKKMSNGRFMTAMLTYIPARAAWELCHFVLGKKPADEGLSLKDAVRAFGRVAAWTFILRPLAALLYPRAEDFLARQGLDPALASELAPGACIYVRTPDSPRARLHRIADRILPSSLSSREAWRRFVSSPSKAGLARRMPGGTNFVFIKTREDQVYRRQEGVLAAEDSYRHALLHELAHCAPANVELPSAHAEGDVDYRAIESLARRAEDPQTLRAHFHRAVALHLIGFESPKHDTTLYIDAISRGAAPEDAELLEKAAKLATAMISVANAHGTEDIRIYTGGPVPELVLARRRIALYFKAKAEHAARASYDSPLRAEGRLKAPRSQATGG